MPGSGVSDGPEGAKVVGGLGVYCSSLSEFGLTGGLLWGRMLV